VKAKGTLLAKCNRRPPSSMRGYSSEWQRIRAETFRLWHIPPWIARGMHVHHFPRYVPGTDHRKYRLLPLPGPEHSRHTILETHAGRPAEWRRTVPPAGELFAETELLQDARFDLAEWE
jgi:hypothetical protein